VDRATLVAFYINGRSLKQMSREFETPVGTIKRRLHVARNRLRDHLTDAGTPDTGDRPLSRRAERARPRALACV
jgi:RNA polymerase sigma-70 factor (ECF subfamily)